MNTVSEIGHTPRDFDQQISDFLRILYGDTPPVGILNLCSKKRGKVGMRSHSFQSSDIDGIIEKIVALRDQEDVFFETCLQPDRPASGKRGNAKSKTVMPGIWMDIDVAGPNHKSIELPQSNEEAMAFVMELAPTIVVDSGGGYHVYFLFDKPWVFKDDAERQVAQATVQYSQEMIIEKGKELGWKLDNTSDLARLLRIPGTYNYKNGEKLEVNIIYIDNEVRYSYEDFEPPPEAQEAVEFPIVKQATPPPVDFQYPLSDAENVIKHCSFSRHCVEDAASLTEPEWFFFLSIIAHTEDGNRFSHKYSAAYPGYSYPETEKKIAHVLTVPPVSCEKIQMNAHADAYCSRCPFRGFVKSPIQLGNVSLNAQLMIQGVKILAGAYSDPGLPFEEESLKVLAKLKRQQPDTYSRIRSGIAKMNISVKALESAMEKLAYEIIDVGAVQFMVCENRTYFKKQTRDGERPIQLSNFSAKITEEIARDDGVSKSIIFKISALLSGGAHLPDVEVPAEEFRGMHWVTAHYGVGAIIQPGQNIQDLLRTGIQSLSTDYVKRNVYAHTGWRKINDQWLFLIANGALGANGLIEDIEVALDGKLQYYAFPKALLDYPPVEAVTASLEILDLAPARISIPLLCTIYRAVLEEVLPCPLTVFIEGQTGTYKSEISGVCLSHYGPAFNGKNLPCEWTSTANAIEKMAFIAKDTIMVVDDYYPGTSRNEAEKKNIVADRIIRGKGNQSGRARMTADGKLRVTYTPRSLILTSGEDIPRGASLRARMYIIEVEKGEINADILTKLQKSAVEGKLAAAMVGYLRWLAPQLDNLKALAQKRKMEIREEVIRDATAHSRTPDVIADLMYGLEYFLKYAIFVGVYTVEQAQDMRDTAIKTLAESNKMLQEVLASEDPVSRFIDLLMTAFMTGAVHLEGMKGGEPSQDADKWGWKITPGNLVRETKPGSKFIGWVNGINLYLNPDATLASVQEIAGKQGSPMTMSPNVLRKRLCERGILVKAGSKYIKTKSIAGSKYKIMHLLTTKMFDEEAAEEEAEDVTQSLFKMSNQSLIDRFLFEEIDLFSSETDNLFG